MNNVINLLIVSYKYSYYGNPLYYRNILKHFWDQKFVVYERPLIKGT